MFGYVLHHADIQSLQQCHSPCKTLLEVYLASHGAFRDGAYLCAHTVALSQFVDTLRLDERRVHIETNQASHSAEHIVALERKVNTHFCRQLQQFRLHVLSVDGFTTQ